MNKKSQLTIFLLTFILLFHSQNLQSQSNKTKSDSIKSLQESIKKLSPKMKILKNQLKSASDSLELSRKTVSSQSDSLRNNRERIAKASAIINSIEQFLQKLPTLPASYNKQLSTIEREQLEEEYYSSIIMYDNFLSPSQQKKQKALKDTLVSIYSVKIDYDKAINLLGHTLNSANYKTLEEINAGFKNHTEHSPIQAVHKEELKKLSKLLEKYTEEQKRLNRILDKIASKVKETPPSSARGIEKRKSELKALIEKETSGKNAFEKEYVYFNYLIEKAKKIIELDHSNSIGIEKLKIELPSK